MLKLQSIQMGLEKFDMDTVFKYIARLLKELESFYIILFTLIFITFINPEIMHNFISFIGSIIPESVYQYFVNVRVGKVLVFDTLKLFLTIQVILFTYLVISYLINIIFNKELFKKLVVKRLFDGVSVVVII